MFFRISLILFVTYSHSVCADWHKQHWDIMGTRVGVELWHDNPLIAQKAIQAVKTEMQRIDQSMSPYIETSEISLINRDAAQHPVKISPELFTLIQKAQAISALSNGTFDITFASIGYLYDYRKHQHPDNKTIKNNLANINYKKIKLLPATSEIFFTQRHVRIDLGGIAKGHAVDRSIEKLKQLGIQYALVSAGGDSRLIGDKRGKPWVTGIRHPRHKGQYIAILPLENTAISTSGDYERFFIENDVRYHHIIQPKTGRSATSSQSVTVLGPDSTTTDALSTTLFILPTQKALKLINSLPQFEAIIINKDGVLKYSSGLDQPTK